MRCVAGNEDHVVKSSQKWATPDDGQRVTLAYQYSFNPTCI